MSLLSATLFAALSFSSSNAQEVNLGGFTGELTTTVTSGFATRLSNNNCKLISGSMLTASEKSARPNFASHVGYEAYSGNGGCNEKEVDTYGNTATKAIERRNSNTDDGGLNFGEGDLFDASQSLSFSFTGRNANGVSLNLSGVGVYNPVLDFTTPAFKALTNKAKDEIDSQIKLGNAYISAPISDNVDITIGNYVQSQGTSALFPIGVNVVNPVSLPLLRSPGTQLKDALLPQAMIGITGYLDNGITAELYYQLEQKELELDAAGSFFGSELVGAGASTGVLSSPFHKELTTRPYGGNYHDITVCANSASAYGDHSGGCGDTGLWTGLQTNGTGTPTDDGNASAYGFYNDMSATVGGTAYAGLHAVRAGASAADFDALVEGGLGAGKALLVGAPGCQKTGVACTNAQVGGALKTMYDNWGGIGTSHALVNIKQAPQAEADDSGQYGINLSGYADDIGSGLEWGFYFNNSHSNAPRIRYLAIADGYATSAYGIMNVLYAAGGSDLLIGGGTASNFEQWLGNTAYGSTIAGVVAKALGPTYGYWASTNGTKSYVHDPGKVWDTYNTLGGAAIHGAAQAASIGAMGTLAFTNGAKYQQYYPEDIKTYGVSLSTGINSWATSLEIAFRPDFPLQISLGDLTNNLIDSQGGTAVQSLITYGSQTAAIKAQIAGVVGTNKWSATPNCDISSTTGKASSTNSGYVECDGTAEFDVWTADLLGVKSYTASEPFVKNAGADSGSLLIEVGTVFVEGIDSSQGLVATNMQSFGHDVYGGGCLDASGTGKVLSGQSNGLFGDGYCESESEADEFSLAYKIRGSLQYSNFNNSKWGFSPSIGFNHDLIGNGPSSIGGFTEDVMSMSLGATFSSSGTQVKLDYINQLGSYSENKFQDRDYLTASISHAF